MTAMSSSCHLQVISGLLLASSFESEASRARWSPTSIDLARALASRARRNRPS